MMKEFEMPYIKRATNIIAGIFFVLLISVNGLYADTVFTDNFSGSYPGDWVIGHDGGGGSYAWAWPNDYAHEYSNPSGGQYWYPDDLHVYMERRNVSLADYSSATLSFNYIVDTEATWDYFTVNVRDQSGSWHELFRASGTTDPLNWTYNEIDLSQFDGQTGLYIQFRFDSDGSISGAPYDGVFIDGVELTASSVQPDLVPYQPPGWGDEIVISDVSGTNTDGTIYVDQAAYIDYSVLNDGDADAGEFYVEIWDDTTNERIRRASQSSLSAGYYYTSEDRAWAFSTPGWHTIRIIVDVDNDINEGSNEGNNEYTRQVYVNELIINQNEIPGASDNPSSVPTYLNSQVLYPVPGHDGGICWATATADILAYWDRNAYNGIIYWKLVDHGFAPLLQNNLPTLPGHNEADVRTLVINLGTRYYVNNQAEDAIIEDVCNTENNLSFDATYHTPVSSIADKTIYFGTIADEIDAGRPVGIGSWGNYFEGAHQIPVIGYIEVANNTESEIYIHRNTGGTQSEYVNLFDPNWGSLDMDSIVPNGTPVDHYDPNDTAGSAKSLDPDDIYDFRQTHNFHDSGDVDWIKFDAESDRRYTISIVNRGSTFLLHTDIYRNGGNDFVKGHSGNSSFSLTYDSYWPETIYIKTYASINDYGHDTNYDIEVSYTEAVPDTDAPVISNVIVASTTDTTGMITWTTDEPANSEVRYGTSSSDWGSYSSSPVTDTAMVTNHSITLTGLTENTMYYFRVGSTDASGNGPDLNSNATNPSDENSFTTSPSPDIDPPSITGYNINYVNDTIDITYDEANMQNANIEANYSFNPTLHFLTTGGSDDITYIGNNTYRLFMSSIPDYTIFILTVTGITDEAANPVTPDSITINDNDNDNMADDWETFWGIDDPVLDQDGDNLTNVQEYNYYISDGWNLNPKSDDTDTDDLPDGWEVSNGLDPTDDTGNNGRDGDFDTDGWTNYEEYINGTNPNDDTDPVPTPPEIVEVNPHHNAGITDSTRVPNNTSFAVRIEDSDGIDTTDLESITFTIDDGVNPTTYEYNLGNTTVVRVVQLDSTESLDNLTKLWVIYDRSRDDGHGNVYSFGATVTISVDAKDKHQDWMDQGVYCFKIETQQQHNDAEANLPPIEAVDPNDPDLEGSYDEGIEVNSGSLEGAKIIYESSEPITPTLGPIDELPSFDGNDLDAIGAPMNLQPPTVFNAPVKIFIPCSGLTDVSNLSVYLYNGTSWVLACDASGNVQPGGEGWIVPGSRVNHNNGSPSTIEIQVYHFTGVQAAASTTPQPPAPTPSGGGGGGGCFIATAAYGTAMEPHVKVLRDFRDRFMINNGVGKAFIDLYSTYSPSVADFIANHNVARLMVRWSLMPFVGMCWMALNIGLIPTLTIILLMLIFINISVVVLFRRIRVGTHMD
jgi:hypothetical protein